MFRNLNHLGLTFIAVITTEFDYRLIREELLKSLLISYHAFVAWSRKIVF